VFALLKIEGLNNTKLLVQCLVINGHGTKQHKTYEAYDRSLKFVAINLEKLCLTHSTQK
jgi:hypothetical protein